MSTLENRYRQHGYASTLNVNLRYNVLGRGLVDIAGSSIWYSLGEKISPKIWNVKGFFNVDAPSLCRPWKPSTDSTVKRRPWWSSEDIRYLEEDIADGADCGILWSLGEKLRRKNWECHVFLSLSTHHICVDPGKPLSTTRLCVDPDGQVMVNCTWTRI